MLYLKTFSDKDRVVTVKGLAEMNMTATSASIALNFSFSGDSLQTIMKQTEVKKNTIIAYLNSLGYSNAAIKINNTDKIINLIILSVIFVGAGKRSAAARITCIRCEKFNPCSSGIFWLLK